MRQNLPLVLTHFKNTQKGIRKSKHCSCGKYYFHICHILLEIGKALSNFTSGCKTDAVCRYNRFGICCNKSFNRPRENIFFFAIDFVYEKKICSHSTELFFLYIKSCSQIRYPIT